MTVLDSKPSAWARRLHERFREIERRAHTIYSETYAWRCQSCDRVEPLTKTDREAESGPGLQVSSLELGSADTGRTSRFERHDMFALPSDARAAVQVIVYAEVDG